MVIKRSCLAEIRGTSPGEDMTIRFIFDGDSGLMCTVYSPASVLLHRWGQTTHDPAFH